MKPKQILILIIAFALLAAIYAIQKSREREVVKGLGYKQVMGEALATSDIYGFTCYLPGEEERAAHLVRQDGVWVVKSKFGAPAKEDKVTDFVKKLQDLKGELRSSSEDILADYGIDDESAVHLVLLDADGREKKHLLLGKQGPNWNEVFVRLAGSSDVYLVRENLRREFGLYSGEVTAPIDSSQWCELTIMNIAKDDLSRVELDAPHRRLILELQKQDEPVAEPESGEPVAEEPAEKPKEEWVMVEPKLDTPPKESGINRLTGAFTNVNVSDVVARGNFENYGLEEPTAGCTITTKSGEIHRLRFGDPLPDGDGAHYVRMNDDDLVYKMDRWKVESIFLKMSNLIDIAAPKFSKAAVTGLTTQGVARSFDFEKKDGSWRTGRTALDSRLKDDQIDRIAGIVANLTPQDVATVASPEITGLDKPSAVVRFSLGDAEKHTLTFGDEVPLTGGDRFVKLDGRKEIWTLSKAHWDTVEPAAAKLFDLELFDFEVDDVMSLTLRDEGGELKLALLEPETPADEEDETSGKQWMIEGDGTVVDQEKVRSILSTLAALSAIDIHEKAENAGLDKPVWSVEAFLVDGKMIDLAIGKQADSSGYYAGVSGDTAVFVLSADTATRLMDLTRQVRE